MLYYTVWWPEYVKNDTLLFWWPRRQWPATLLNSTIHYIMWIICWELCSRSVGIFGCEKQRNLSHASFPFFCFQWRIKCRYCYYHYYRSGRATDVAIAAAYTRPKLNNNTYTTVQHLV